MKLYYGRGACSLAVRIILNEIDIPCEFIRVDLKTKKTDQGKDFLEINPKGMVPVLIIDQNKVLTENAVIQQYLADQYSAVNLLPPSSDFQRYEILEWINFITTELHKTASPLFNPKLPSEVKDEFFIPALKNKLQFVDKQLEGKKYLLGDHFTLADAYLFVILSWLPRLQISLKEFNNFFQYFEDLKKYPSIMHSLKEEEIESE